MFITCVWIVFPSARHKTLFQLYVGDPVNGTYHQHPTVLSFLPIYAGWFLLAIISEKYVFANANLKSETFVGCFVLVAALLLMLFRQERAATVIADAFCGYGIGILGSRFLLFFIKLAHHCERGTSQSTFFLSWETGMALGMALGWSLASREALIVALCLIVAALVIYNFLVHPWYLTHKNR